MRRLSGVTDNSLYPVMFMSYLDVLVPVLKGSWQRTCALWFPLFPRCWCQNCLGTCTAQDQIVWVFVFGCTCLLWQF